MRYVWDQFDAYFGPDQVGALRSRLLRDAEGQPIFLQGVAFDISAIKETEEELNRRVQQRTEELNRARNEAEKALDEVHAGTLPPSRAQAMASLATAMVRVLTAGELEERLRELEGRVQKGVAS